MDAIVSIFEMILCCGNSEEQTRRIQAAGAKIYTFGGHIFDPDGYKDIPVPQSVCHGQAVALAIGIAVAAIVFFSILATWHCVHVCNRMRAVKNYKIKQN